MINVAQDNSTAKLKHQQMLADMLAKSPSTNNGTFLGALSEALRGGMQGYLGGKIASGEEALKQQRQQELAKALQTAGTGVPAWNNPDNPSQELIPAVKPGADALAAALASSQNPDLQESALGLKMKQFDPSLELQRENMALSRENAARDYALQREKFNYDQSSDAQDRALRQQQLEYQKNQDDQALVEVIDPLTGQSSYATAGEVRKNPSAFGGKTQNKPSDTERTAAGYADRMAKASNIINSLEGSGYSPITAGEAFWGNTNVTASPKKQQYSQAQKDWVRAKLRKESGAVISEPEMASEISTYFPQFGDSPDVLKQKAEARAVAEDAMRRGAGNLANTIAPSQSMPIKFLGFE